MIFWGGIRILLRTTVRPHVCQNDPSRFCLLFFFGFLGLNRFFRLWPSWELQESDVFRGRKRDLWGIHFRSRMEEAWVKRQSKLPGDDQITKSFEPDSRSEIPSLKLTVGTWKWMVWRLLSFWGPAYFQGLCLLVSGRVTFVGITWCLCWSPMLQFEGSSEQAAAGGGGRRHSSCGSWSCQRTGQCRPGIQWVDVPGS